MAGADATVVVIIARTKQRLKEAGALSAETAKTPSDLGLGERWLKMSRGAGVIATDAGRYYLRTK